MINAERGRAVGLLVIAFIALVLSNGRWIVSPATWIAPILLLRFIERRAPLLAWRSASSRSPSRTPSRGGDSSQRPVALYYAIVGTYGVVYGGILAAVLLLGAARLGSGTSDERHVRAAAIMSNQELTRALERAIRATWESRNPAAFDSITELAAQLNDDLFARTQREGAAGAELIAWSETAGRTLKAKEDSFLARGQGAAKAMGVYLVLAYGTWTPGATPPFENKLVAIAPDGTIACTITKQGRLSALSLPSSMLERERSRFSTRRLAASAPYICHDLDFPDFIRQVGRRSIDILVAPSADWDDIATMHARMAALRGIENGFALFRPTSTGLSIATEAAGRTLATLPAGPKEMIASVPGLGRRTVYSRVGEAFAQLCVVLFTVVATIAVRQLRTRSPR